MADKDKKKKRYRKSFTFEGKRYFVSGRTKKEAERKAIELQVKLEEHVRMVESPKTISQWLKGWVDTYESSISRKSQKRYELVISRFCDWSGDQRMDRVTQRDVQMYINSLSGLSEETVKKYQQILYRFFQTAAWAGVVVKSPVFDIRLPKCRPTIHRRRITDTEREMILTLAEHHPMGLYIKVMLYCGLRTMEVAALDGRHIDLNKRLIHVRQAVKTDGTIGEPKSQAGKRDIPIPGALLPDLQRLDLQPYAPAIPHHGRCGDVRYTETTVKAGWRDFKRQLSRLGPVAPDLCLYDLRHTYCTDLEAAGVPINIARDLMGHASVTVTSRVYTHRTEESLERARDLIDNFQCEKTGKMDEKYPEMCRKRDI